MPPTGRRSRARRVLGVIGAVVGTTVTFVAATAAAAVVHLDAPVTRRVVQTQANGILKSTLAGEVSIEHIDGLGLRGLSGVRVRIKDPTGLQVLYVDNLTVRVQGIAAARSALFGKGNIVIPVDLVSIGHVDADVDGDAAGNLRIANVFALRNPSPPTPSDPNARGVRVDAPTVALGSAWIHGQPPGAPPVDAELHELAAKAHYDGKLITADLDRVDLVTRGLPRGVDPHGRIGGKFAMPSATGQSMGLDAAFDGVLAGVPTTAHLAMDGQKLDATVDGRDPSGSGVRATFGEVAIEQEVTLHAEAHGELPRIAAKAHVAVGRGTVDVDAHADLSDGTKADAVIAVRHVDLHGILAAAPPSDVGFDTTANVTIAKSGAIDGKIVLVTLPGSVSGQALPILDLKGDFTGATAHAVGHVTDPRAKGSFDVDMITVGANRVLSGTVHTDIADLSLLPSPTKVHGHATVDAEGTVNLGTRAISAKTHLVAGALAYQEQRIDNATVLATVNGTLDHPEVDVGVHAGGVSSGKEQIGVAEVRGKIEPGATTTIRDAHVDIVRGGHNVALNADRVQIGGANVLVDNAVITGLGEPVRASGSRDGNQIHLVLGAPSIDLVRVAQLAGKPGVVKSGTLSMIGDVTLRSDNATGELHMQVDSLSTEQINGAKVKLDAKFAGRKVDLDMDAELAEAGRLELATTNFTIGGPPSNPESWKKAHGRAKFAANLDMRKLETLLPPKTIPLSELSGQLVVEGIVRRPTTNAPPEVLLHAHTRGLVAAGLATPEPPHDATHKETVSGVQPWRSEGIDASIDAFVDPTSGLAELAFHVVDKKGTLVGFDAKSVLPYDEMVANPDRALALLEKTPVNARLVIPKRPLADLPDLAGVGRLPGTIEAELNLTGTALDPHLNLKGHGRGIRSATLSPTLAADADIDLDYDGQKADLVGKVTTQKHEALDIGVHFDVKARDIIAPANDQPLAWGGSANVKLAAFPLQAITPLADRRVRGKVSGTASITDLHKDAKLNVDIAFADLKVGRAQYTGGKITVVNADNKVNATVRLDQKDGYLDLKAGTGLTWGAELVPTVDPSVDTQAHLEAKNFSAAAALPFVGSAVNELDGRIEADATVKIGPGFSPAMDGSVKFHDGLLQLSSVGEEYKNVTANVSFQPGGVVKIDDISLKGTEGSLTGSAMVKTRGLGLDSATAQVEIPKKKPLDLSIQGTGLGAVSGKVSVVAQNSADGKNLKVTVDVPTLDLTLPQKLKSGVQELSSNPDVRIGVFRDPKSFVKLPLTKADLAPPKATQPVTTTIDVDLKLGEITIVEGQMARVVVGGTPHVKITNKTEMTGQIEVKQGTVDVQGKSFTIEKGTITFQPDDTSNPVVIATAEWTAEDGSKIYADFVGPVKTGKVTLRSDPPRPRDEVLAIILFGTADGANAAPGSGSGGSTDGTTKAAVGLGGGFAATGLTEALDDLTGIQATAKIDSSRSANPAPEIEIQIARRISLAFEHVLGTPPISDPDINLATVDWRFRRNWSLETTVGDHGKIETDAVWQKRY